MAVNRQAEVRLQGLALSEGYAVGRVCLFNDQRHNKLPQYRVDGKDLEREVLRVQQAIQTAGERLEQIRLQVEQRIGSAEAEIFVAHRMILDDKGLLEKILGLIRQDRVNAETAVTRALDAVEMQLRDVDDEYIKERASDFGEIKRRLLDVLSDMNPALQCSMEQHCQRGRNRIVVAEELTPTLTTELDAEHVLGFATERGGMNSHAAILARALNVPAVSGLEGIRRQIGCGAEILVNGNTGEVILWPTDETVRQVQASERRPMRKPAAVDPVDGFKVMANINVAADVGEALEMKAEGIGLYRTEIEVITAGRLLSEAELRERYASVRKALAPQEVIYRMFDLGSDKVLPSLELPAEGNPSLGWRGSRLLLGRPDLLTAQARALAWVSREGPISVMYPMVIDLDQFLALRKLFEEATAGIPRGVIRHGVMFEVPSACLQAREILGHADFGSIGTNDLTQYLFAVDRDNENVAHDYNPDHPVLWALLQQVVAAGRAAGKPVSVCGEVGGDPKYLDRLVGAGIRSVSVSARRIPVIRAVAATKGRGLRQENRGGAQHDQ